ncbi:BF3164 family lipoprotein [Phocaeicola sp.]|uniref:BF3164 family lipoprotein n=1 Tax=Phocaeicola sp. TaxID=2773926 RepID=UPI0023BBB3B1|nr:BF3164 family lipoprotein [Phocaeicola sp.]MDE5678254.1 TolB-like 6-bladed beta-propeller domain-containing protein [Phocaeicola sp.]
MKIYYIIILLSVFQLFSACTETNEKIVTSFPKEGNLQAEAKHTPSPFLLPRYVGITGDYLFVYKEREEHLFSFFRLPDADFIADMGNRGQGPNDFNLLDTRSFYSTPSGFKVVEAGMNMLKTVDYDGKELKVTHTESILEQGISNNGLYPLADSMFLTLGWLDEDNEYRILNGKNGQAMQTHPYPKWTNQRPNPKNAPLFVTFLKSCVVHPNKEKVAAFYSRFKRIRIYDSKKMNLLHDISVQIPPYAAHPDELIEKQPVYYIGQPYTTENYIYALCANKQPDTTSGTCELQVWDWNGEPIACYKFDRKVTLMTISEKHHKIYALDNAVPDEIYMYDLPLY